jgi:hypothetical protein
MGWSRPVESRYKTRPRGNIAGLVAKAICETCRQFNPAASLPCAICYYTAARVSMLRVGISEAYEKCT